MVTAGVFVYMRPQAAVQPGLRDAVADRSAIGQLGGGGDSVSVPEPKAEVVNKGYIGGNAPASASVRPVKFVTIPGGKFTLGTDSDESDMQNAKPPRDVTIKTFEMSKTAVTVEQYAECVIKGECTEPDTGGHCNWGKTDRWLHPVNCVSWYQANQYAEFKNARLPSESEWEYAATSGGRNRKYPWGNGEPARELAVFNAAGTMPVCSKPKGNTAQGLCDMAGNVYQWVQDKYRSSYAKAPADGSAFKGEGIFRVIRGGAFISNNAAYLRADFRNYALPGSPDDSIGFRLARSR